MRMLFTMQPAFGHFHPLAPLAGALAAAGHEVAFACGRRFCPTVAAAGFTCFPAGLDGCQFGHAWPEPMVADLVDLCSRWSPRLVVRDALEFGGALVAERLGIPQVSVQVGSYSPPEPPWHLIGAELASVRRRFGLSPANPYAMLYPDLHITFAPPSFQRLGAFVPRTTRALRMQEDRQWRVPPLPAWVDNLPERPIVYASLGTVSASFDPRTARLHDVLLAGLRDLPINLILTVGHDFDPATLGPQPENVHIAQYLPQTTLFRRCDAVVTHGGYGTVLDAIRAGLPMVILPLFADQPENARRCAILGVAEVISPDEVSADQVRSATLQILQTPSYRRNTCRVGLEMEALPTVDSAIALLEELAA
jgi:UDP:flavonoid glycosyltransferase YjiC (YdhE family)